MTKASSGNFQRGMFIKFRDEIHQIIDFQHVNPGKGSAFIRTKLKNINTGNNLEFTFKSGETVKGLSVLTRNFQYLYRENQQFYFMDPESFNQLQLEDKVIGAFRQFLKEGTNYQIYVYDNRGIGIKIPKKVKLEVTDAEEGVKGNTVTGAKKTVTLETGLKIQVPLFIKKGNLVSVNPETNEYLERVN